MWSLPSTPSLVPVSVDHQENKNKESDNEQKYRNRLAFQSEWKSLEISSQSMPAQSNPSRPKAK